MIKLISLHFPKPLIMNKDKHKKDHSTKTHHSKGAHPNRVHPHKKPVQIQTIK